jgi:hypothetical protein
MWADNADGEYVATGGYEWGSTYTTPRQGSVSVINYNLQQVYLDAVWATNHYGDVATRSSRCCRRRFSSARAHRFTLVG